MRTAPFDLITVDDVEAASNALTRLGLIDSGEPIESMGRAGEGNMNVVIRVVTPHRRLIIKQSRPWVEKYPQIDAPADRIFSEIDFYRRIQEHDSICRSVPRMLGYDRNAHLLVLEDLGEANDYTDVYDRRTPDDLPLEEAINWLAKLHAIELQPDERDRVGNRELRQLNHAHIFVIPLQSPSAISLDAICNGLDSLADEVRGNPIVAEAADELGKRYLGTGDFLLHGDYYPGSWLRTESGLRIIDPEFTFAGPVEFDLGILAAHRVLAGGGSESPELIAEIYKRAGGETLDKRLLCGFFAMEIIRRLIGVAQLPLSANLMQRAKMIEIAVAVLEE
jgi:5-methylthioribose kinase